MVVNNPNNPKIGDYVKPRFDKDKFIEEYQKFNSFVNNKGKGEVYDALIKRNHQFRTIHNRGDNLCVCHVGEESLGWIVPIQCLKRVKV